MAGLTEIDFKNRIARRCALEIEDGDFVNLGIGLPTLVGNFIPQDYFITLHSENGFIGLDGDAKKGCEDADIVNAGAVYSKVAPHVCYFDSCLSFDIMRAGFLDKTVIGAMQVSRNGDIASWIVPGKIVAGMGGAMDLVVGAKSVIVGMLHTQKGEHKILDKCTLPLTAPHAASLIVTEMCVMKVVKEGLLVTEIHSDYTKEQVQSATGTKLLFSPDLQAMRL